MRQSQYVGMAAQRGIRRQGLGGKHIQARSEEHTSELQSLMRISYAVSCLQTKKPHKQYNEISNYETKITTIHTITKLYKHQQKTKQYNAVDRNNIILVINYNTTNMKTSIHTLVDKQTTLTETIVML